MPRAECIFLVLAGLALAAPGCRREERRFREPPGAVPPASVTLGELRPGLSPPPPEAANPYENNAYALSEGRRLFVWFNCLGCHSNGGGGIGPALMDDSWIYGDAPANVFASIVEGRPNGMPAYRARLNDQQVWQLAAYVRSLGGSGSKAAKPGRGDELQARPSPQSTEAPAEERQSGAPPPP